MKDGPSIAAIAALLGDRARADILTALMAGPALTATELAAEAGVTKQTASAHLAKLVEARLIAVESQGRHRYFRLADRDVAQLIESLMGVAYRAGAVRLRTSPREPALRKARVCYDHLAGELGVRLYDALIGARLITADSTGLALSPRGARSFAELGIDLDALAQARRPLCRACLDWSARRHHLAGALGAALLGRFLALGWARVGKGSRLVAFSRSGESALRQRFGLAETQDA
ncbi:MAG TPA: winged helix-turn-helix domain-containing protein [Casimicrobiaceae bacterium]|nr:winged helix-turn-helix domain-containing protein [Casimicrobiaceae bacterium]